MMLKERPSGERTKRASWSATVTVEVHKLVALQLSVKL